MTNPKAKPAQPRPAKPRELTPEEKAEQIARFLSQKRESFALSAFAALMRHPDAFEQDPKVIAEQAVSAADALLDKLYPLQEGNPAE